jgi:hypothetical protein
VGTRHLRSARGLAAAAGLLAILATASPASAAPANSPPARDTALGRENANLGDGSWHSERVKTPEIEGYSSNISVGPGERIDFAVSTRPAARYRIEIIRLGWYGGAGGRRLACLPSCTTSAQGFEQSEPPLLDAGTGRAVAGWQMTDNLTIPVGWISGYYIAKLMVLDGPHAGVSRRVPFIVRGNADDRSEILAVAPVNTWQAYNNWGGKSLYYGSSTFRMPANHVSFDRPLLERDWIFKNEFPMVRFLERQGYNMSYVTDIDVHRRPWILQRHRLVIVLGHGEYWSRVERTAFERARDARVNLFFAGANTAYWQIRYADQERTVVGYKAFPDPIPQPWLKTTKFRYLQPARPECRLLGVQFRLFLDPHAANALPYRVTSAARKMRWFGGTGLRPGDRVYVVGNEWDRVVESCMKPKPMVLFHYGGTPKGDAVAYRDRSGAMVFSGGSLQFALGLDSFVPAGDPKTFNQADPRLQRFACNVIADMTRGPRVKLRYPVPCDTVQSTNIQPDDANVEPGEQPEQ